MTRRTPAAGRLRIKPALALRFIPVVSAARINRVARLARTIWTEHYIAITGKAQVDYMLARFQSPEAIAGQIKEGYGYYLINAGRRHIGYVAILPQPKRQELFISKLYVLDSQRGKGIGRQAMAFIERLAATHNLRRLTLTVNKHNTGSQAFYLACGFVKSGSVVKDIGQGFVMDDYVMKKTLERKEHARVLV